MTKARQWPNKARSALNDSALAANHIQVQLWPIVHGEGRLTDTDILRRCAIALNDAHTISRLLEAQGAQTVPPQIGKEQA